MQHKVERAGCTGVNIAVRCAVEDFTNQMGKDKLEAKSIWVKGTACI